MLLLFGLVFYSKDRKHWKRALGVYWLVGLVVMATLMYGGVFGMPVVETSQWSGFPLTLMLSLFGVITSYSIHYTKLYDATLNVHMPDYQGLAMFLDQ